MNPALINHQDQLRNELKAFKPESNLFTYEELLSLLTKKGQKPFDASLLQNIFTESGSDSSRGIAAEEFISAFNHLESSLKTRVETVRKNLKDLSSKLISARTGQIEAKANKAPEDNNLLTISVLKGNLNTDDKIVARVICDEWEVTTNPASTDQSWNESFSFNPQTYEDILIEFWIYTNNTLQHSVGSVTLPFAVLRNEEIIEKWFRVSPSNVHISQVLLKLHWVQSKVNYLERLVKEIELQIEAERKDLKSAEEDYAKMISLFVGKNKSEGIEEEISKGIDQFFAGNAMGVNMNRAYYAGVYFFVVVTGVCMMMGVGRLNVFGM